jgi:hypothetical protein
MNKQNETKDISKIFGYYDVVELPSGEHVPVPKLLFHFKEKDLKKVPRKKFEGFVNNGKVSFFSPRNHPERDDKKLRKVIKLLSQGRHNELRLVVRGDPW